MKTTLLIILLGFLSLPLAAQQTKPTIYNPAADAKAEIALAVSQAKASGKHVFIQVGGNWCGWCIRFHNLTTQDAQLDSAFNANFVRVKLNYSEENRNLPLLAEYGFPQRFGFPVFLVLDGDGKLIHTQNSAYLEEGKGHSKAKILEFIAHWGPAAFDPSRYKDE
ncbi:MAG: thioredoxin family protein [Bacteroidetes bacterium]|nr:thioredoxin family protein [Bacteroidota bacterium]